MIYIAQVKDAVYVMSTRCWIKVEQAIALEEE